MICCENIVDVASFFLKIDFLHQDQMQEIIFQCNFHNIVNTTENVFLYVKYFQRKIENILHLENILHITNTTLMICVVMFEAQK